MAEAFGIACHEYGDSASVQAVTRVNAEQALYGAFIVKRFQSSDLSFLLSRSVSLFDVESRFFAPTRSIAKPARAGAVKVGRRPNLAAYSGLARPHLDSFEHDGRLDVGRDDDQRGACHRARIIAPQPCIR